MFVGPWYAGKMSDELEIQAVSADALSAAERQRFQELVIKGGEVGGAALETNISSARILIVIREQGVICGVGALKRPQDSYREKVIKKAELALASANYPYELGYIFIEPSLRGRGLSHGLLATALDHSDGAGVFATVRTDNAAMRASLEAAGFTPAGRIYEGREKDRKIGVLLRAGRLSRTTG
jgi:RimJ/RimL family protein N-acetyltransferase